MKAWILVSVLAIGCGGSVTPPIGDGGGDGSSDGGGPGCQTLIGCPCGQPVCVNNQWLCPKCADPCAALAMRLELARRELRQCCPTCKSVQCQGTAADVCCDITTNGGDATEFAKLVTEYKAMCNPICPGAVCPPVPSGTCDPDEGSQTLGFCR